MATAQSFSKNTIGPHLTLITIRPASPILRRSPASSISFDEIAGGQGAALGYTPPRAEDYPLSNLRHLASARQWPDADMTQTGGQMVHLPWSRRTTMAQSTTVVSPDVIQGTAAAYCRCSAKRDRPRRRAARVLQHMAGGACRFGGIADSVELGPGCHHVCRSSYFGCAGRRRRRKGSIV